MRAVFWENMHQVNERLAALESKTKELEVRLLATELLQIAPKVNEVTNIDELEDILCG